MSLVEFLQSSLYGELLMLLFGGKLSVKDERQQKEKNNNESSDLVNQLKDREMHLLEELNHTRGEMEHQTSLNQALEHKHVKSNEFSMLPVLTKSGESPFQVNRDKAGKFKPIFELPSVLGKPKAPRKYLVETSQESRVVGEVKMEAQSVEIKVRKKGGKKKVSRKSKKKSSAQDLLRKELKHSIRSVQSFNKLVKNDITAVHQMCPVNNIRAELYLRKWGVATMKNILARMQQTLVKSAIANWRDKINLIKQKEQLDLENKLTAVRQLSSIADAWAKRQLCKSWDDWLQIVYMESRKLREMMEAEAIVKIQNAWRGYQSRQYTKRIRAQVRDAARNAAATKIQRGFRSRYLRKLGSLMLQRLKETKAAIRIQAVMRGTLARIASRAKLEKLTNMRAARQIQAMYRGRLGRRKAAEARFQRKLNQNATIIQRRFRGRLGRKRYIVYREYVRKTKAATKLQCRARIWKAHRVIIQKRKDRDALAKLRLESAIKIQATYRGHRGRLSIGLQMGEIRERKRRQHDAAICIQAYYRGRLGRKKVEQLRASQQIEMIEAARDCTEHWDDESQCFYYYIASTAKSLYEPPDTGYVKKDTRLVLSDGKTMDDPLLATDGNEALSKAEHDGNVLGEDGDIMCVECEAIEASRHCDQCEDNYCDQCYEDLHSAGKRKEHTWQIMGPLRCMECGINKATRWCVECDDPYCLGCFQIIHAKGKKSLHEWTKHTHGHENTATYDEYVQSDEYYYASAEGYQPEVHEGGGYDVDANQMDAYDENGYALEQGATYDESAVYDASMNENYGGEEYSEWRTLVDETSGLTYYYNASTGETQWA